MLISNNAIYCIDFSVTMGIKFLLTKNIISESALLQRIRRHPFYSETPVLQAFAITGSQIQPVVDSVPDEWLQDIDDVSANLRQNIITGLETIFYHSTSTLQRRLKILPEIQLESLEEMHKRTLNNRRAFEAATGKKL
jgi:hypothetical protein